MTTDLAFWKTSRELKPQKVDRRLIEGKPVRGLEAMDADAVETALLAAFPDWRRDATRSTTPRQTMLADDDRGAMDVFWTADGVIASCYGMGPDDLNRVIDVMIELRMPLYDPQIDERFALS
jgi:hypothetical protein